MEPSEPSSPKYTELEAPRGITARFRGFFSSLSPAERFIAVSLSGLLTASAALALWHIHRNSLVVVPVVGGSLSEGIVGSPRFVNPLLAASDADRDLVALVYSGLMRAAPEGGLGLDLAESYDISDDGLVYTFVLKPAKFHDGEPITAADVAFTITMAQDSRTKSAKRANWENVAVEIIDDRRVRFILPKPYAPFLENMTLGILPRHLWEETSPDEFAFSVFNVRPIGSGPYRVKSVRQNASGIPAGYKLTAFGSYVGGRPYLSNLYLRFYPNEDSLIEAFKSSEIESLSGITPERLSELKLERAGARIERRTLPRVFAVFFNQNQMPIFTHEEVRRAFSAAIDKDALIVAALAGFGTPIDTPLPLVDSPTEEASDEARPSEEVRLQKARAMLEEAGWRRDAETGVYEKKTGGKTERLAFTLATADSPELKNAAMFVKETWEALGTSVDLKVFEIGDLTQNIIRPRKYDALLFGEAIGRDLDLYAFWHSSQRADPGLNIALYANIRADELLSQARTITDDTERLEKLEAFAEEVRKDIPAVFLYTPDFLYVLPERIQGFTLTNTTVPEERFLSIADWYSDTERVWSIFIEEQATLQN